MEDRRRTDPWARYFTELEPGIYRIELETYRLLEPRLTGCAWRFQRELARNLPIQSVGFELLDGRVWQRVENDEAVEAFVEGQTLARYLAHLLCLPQPMRLAGEDRVPAFEWILDEVDRARLENNAGRRAAEARQRVREQAERERPRKERQRKRKVQELWRDRKRFILHRLRTGNDDDVWEIYQSEWEYVLREYLETPYELPGDPHGNDLCIPRESSPPCDRELVRSYLDGELPEGLLDPERTEALGEAPDSVTPQEVEILGEAWVEQDMQSQADSESPPKYVYHVFEPSNGRKLYAVWRCQCWLACHDTLHDLFEEGAFEEFAEQSWW